MEHIYETFPKEQLTRELRNFTKVTAQTTPKSYKQANFKQQFQCNGSPIAVAQAELSVVIERLTTRWVSQWAWAMDKAR